jgi:hypothetical protein
LESRHCPDSPLAGCRFRHGRHDHAGQRSPALWLRSINVEWGYCDHRESLGFRYQHGARCRPVEKPTSFGHNQPCRRHSSASSRLLMMRHNIVMRCPEKENLQRQCSAAWYEYQKAVEKSGLPALKDAGLINPETMTLSQRYLAPITLRQDHLSASFALSRHLAAHRC